MSDKKYYAVVRGYNPGIYETWDECQKQVEGYSGAVFQKFTNKKEAEDFISNYDENNNTEEGEPGDYIADYNEEIEKDLNDNKVVIFTDGSFSGGEKPASGYGRVIITPDGNVEEKSNTVYTTKYETTNNIGPEVLAVLESLDWVLSNGYESVSIYHDLELIGKWANGDNKANAPISKLFLRELKEKYSFALDINFKWVPGHKGIKYNERADALAKEGVYRKKPVSKYGKNSFMGRGVDKKQVDKIINTFSDYPDVEHFPLEDNDNKESHLFQFNQEKLTVSYFKNKGTTLLQGKVQQLFSEFLSMYTLKINDFEMIKAYSDSFKKTIKDKEIQNVIESYSLPNDYPKDIITLLKQSLIFLDLEREEYDYSHYTMPCLRALEGHFKYLAAKEGVEVKGSLGSYFYPRKSGPQILNQNSDDGKKLSDSKNAEKFEEIYTFIKIKRNPLFHFGSITVNGEGYTFIIEDIEDAKDIIRRAIDIIVN